MVPQWALPTAAKSYTTIGLQNMGKSGEGIVRYVANLVYLISCGNDVSGVMNGLSLELM